MANSLKNLRYPTPPPTESLDEFPLGQVILWNESLDGNLPEWFVKANGQVLSDIESPLHNTAMPNYNGVSITKPVTYTNNSRVITMDTTNNIYLGATVESGSVPTGTVITEIIDATTARVSANATATGSATTNIGGNRVGETSDFPRLVYLVKVKLTNNTKMIKGYNINGDNFHTFQTDEIDSANDFIPFYQSSTTSYKKSPYNSPITLRMNATVTVGPGGDYSTINDALEYLSEKYYPIYRKFGTVATIELLEGFYMQEQVLVNDTDLGWIHIISSAGGDPISVSSFEQGTQIADYEQAEISTLVISDYDVNVLTDASVLNGQYVQLQAGDLSNHYFWFSSPVYARASFEGLVIRHDVAGIVGNDFTATTINPGTVDAEVSVSLNVNDLEITLGTDGLGELDGSKNTAALIADAINALVIDFTAYGTSSVVSAINTYSFTNGADTGTQPSGTGTAYEITISPDDNAATVAGVLNTSIDTEPSTNHFNSSVIASTLTIANVVEAEVENIFVEGSSLSATTVQEGRDVAYYVQVNALAHELEVGDSIIISSHTGLQEERDYNGRWTVRIIDTNSFELSEAFWDPLNAGVASTASITKPVPVPVSRAHLTEVWEFFYYPAFGVSRGTLPTIGCIFEMDSSGSNSYMSYKDGLCATDRGNINLLPFSGFRNAGGSNIYGTRSSNINANDADANNAGRYGVWAYGNTVINARRVKASNCGWAAVENLILENPGFENGWLNGESVGSGIIATRGSIINADGCEVWDSVGDNIVSEYGATINVGSHFEDSSVDFTGATSYSRRNFVGIGDGFVAGNENAENEWVSNQNFKGNNTFTGTLKIPEAEPDPLEDGAIWLSNVV